MLVEDLPIKLKKLYIEECAKQGRKYSIEEKMKVHVGIDWSRSSQGHNFWSNIDSGITDLKQFNKTVNEKNI